MTPQEKQMIFKLWSQMGVGFFVLKYIAFRFRTLEDYYKAVAEFYGLEGGVQGLKQDMLKTANDFLSVKEMLPCPGGTIRLFDIDLEGRMTSMGYTLDIKKEYTSCMAKFAYTEDPDFKCPYEDEHNDCYDLECLSSPTQEVNSIFKKKYGIRISGFEFFDEKNVVGKIGIRKYK
jgi:hypothetical protein